MNPLTNVKNITKLNERELSMGISNTASWHNQYKDSAWVFVGGLPYQLSEGDVLTVFSQYGEIVNINLVRDKATGKSKGFCFICYEDQRSTILAVDNLNGIQLLKRTIRVDHVLNYKVPKEYDNDDEITKRLKQEGCAPRAQEVDEVSDDSDDLIIEKAPKKSKKSKKKKKKKKKKKSNDSSSSSDSEPEVKVKVEKKDAAYDKYLTSNQQNNDIKQERQSERRIVKQKRMSTEPTRRKNDRDENGRSRDTSSSYHKRSRSRSMERSHKKRSRSRSIERSYRKRSRSRSADRYHRKRSRSRSNDRSSRNERSRDSYNKSSRKRSRSHDRYC